MKTEIKTTTGFTCEVDRDRMDDWEFAQLVAEADNNPGKILAVCMFVMNKILDPEDAERLKEHVKTESGRVPMSALEKELTEILNGGIEKN